MDANQTAVLPDIVEMLIIAYDSCRPTNATMGYMTIKPGIVASVIVNDIRSFWNLTKFNMVIYRSKSLNLNLNLIVFSENQAIKCLL